MHISTPLITNVEARSPQVEWLDFVIYLIKDQLRITQRPLLGAGPTKHALPAFVPQDKGSPERLWWWIASRTHRASQIYAQDERNACFAITDAARYARTLGYPCKHIQRCFSRLRHLPGVARALHARNQFWCQHIGLV